MSLSPVVHYRGASVHGGLAFACLREAQRVYQVAWDAEVARRRRARGDADPDDPEWHAGDFDLMARVRIAAPTPLRSTDLARVTCPRCWQEIAAMAARPYE